MSQSSLKKELSKLTVPQIVEIILDAYKARPEIKEYFEFYLNPDVEKLSEKTRKIIVKEYGRSKWRNSKARVSVINKAIKKFESFQPGAEATIDLLLFILNTAAEAEKKLQFTDAQFRHISKTVEKLLTIADANELTPKLLENLNQLVAPEYRFASRYFKRLVNDAVLLYNSEKAITMVSK